jgi:hypothetical protein
VWRVGFTRSAQSSIVSITGQQRPWQPGPARSGQSVPTYARLAGNLVEQEFEAGQLAPGTMEITREGSDRYFSTAYVTVSIT